MNRKLAVVAFVLLMFMSGFYVILTSPLRVNYHQQSGTSGGSTLELNANYTVQNGKITEFSGNYVVTDMESSADGSTRTVTRSGTCTTEAFSSEQSAECQPMKRIMALWDVMGLSGNVREGPGEYSWEINVG
ncbi:Uncharacterised protein [Candidatus Burarchaeum australiense]|nr:Uncharacterised protein [Candidatus Burarchaeum australiense]